MKIHYSLAASLIAIALPVTALALSVNVNGVNVQVDSGIGGVPNSTINVTTSGAGSSAAANVNVNGTVVNLQRSGSSLNVLVGQGSLTGDDRTVLVNLSGGADTLIKTDADLQAYNSLVVQERPAIVSVSTADNTLQVGYRQPGKFLGIIGGTINGTVVVDANGKVTVKFPWYSFLFSKDDSVATNVAASVQGAQVSVVGSSGTDSVTIRNKAKLINVVTSSINANAAPSASASTTTSTNSASSEHTACKAPADFPFSQYASIVDVSASSHNGTVIGGNIDVNSQSQSSLVIGQAVDMGPANSGAQATSVYAFTALDLGTDSSIGTAYISSGTTADLKGHVGSLVRLSKADLVRKAMVAAGLLGAECNY